VELKVPLKKENIMSDLRTTYMGIPLKNPIMVGSSPLSTRVETIKAMEDAGASAVVLKSLFEE
jgi:dihydroorotate dehydrogenase (fumarate)